MTDAQHRCWSTLPQAECAACNAPMLQHPPTHAQALQLLEAGSGAGELQVTIAWAGRASKQ